LDPKVADGLPKLLDFQRAVTVVIHYLEDPLHPEDPPGTPLGQLISKEHDQVII
jgi:hypothetical protein